MLEQTFAPTPQFGIPHNGKLGGKENPLPQIVQPVQSEHHQKAYRKSILQLTRTSFIETHLTAVTRELHLTHLLHPAGKAKDRHQNDCMRLSSSRTS